jgi:hypothetical protein
VLAEVGAISSLTPQSSVTLPAATLLERHQSAAGSKADPSAPAPPTPSGTGVGTASASGGTGTFFFFGVLAAVALIVSQLCRPLRFKRELGRPLPFVLLLDRPG